MDNDIKKMVKFILIATIMLAFIMLMPSGYSASGESVYVSELWNTTSVGDVYCVQPGNKFVPNKYYTINEKYTINDIGTGYVVKNKNGDIVSNTSDAYKQIIKEAYVLCSNNDTALKQSDMDSYTCDFRAWLTSDRGKNNDEVSEIMHYIYEDLYITSSKKQYAIYKINNKDIFWKENVSNNRRYTSFHSNRAGGDYIDYKIYQYKLPDENYKYSYINGDSDTDYQELSKISFVSSYDFYEKGYELWEKADSHTHPKSGITNITNDSNVTMDYHDTDYVKIGTFEFQHSTSVSIDSISNITDKSGTTIDSSQYTAEITKKDNNTAIIIKVKKSDSMPSSIGTVTLKVNGDIISSATVYELVYNASSQKVIAGSGTMNNTFEFNFDVKKDLIPPVKLNITKISSLPPMSGGPTSGTLSGVPFKVWAMQSDGINEEATVSTAGGSSTVTFNPTNKNDITIRITEEDPSPTDTTGTYEKLNKTMVITLKLDNNKWVASETTDEEKALTIVDKHAINVTIKNQYISPIKIGGMVDGNSIFNKVDQLDAPIEGAKFKAVFEQGGSEIATKTTTSSSTGMLEFDVVKPQSTQDVTVTITEESAPIGYVNSGYNKRITFEYDKSTHTWNAIKSEKYNEETKEYKADTFEVKSTYKDKTTYVKLENVVNPSKIEKLTLLKTSTVSETGNVAGAKFKITLSNVSSIGNFQIPTLGESQNEPKTIYVHTDSDGQIVLEDIEIADLRDNVVITIEETWAPIGYKKIDGQITLTLKREGTNYSIHKTEKESTVTDEEFTAGEVTISNHELTLNIKDIPIMNLGGIVWAEKEKTDKTDESERANSANYKYGDETFLEEALGGITVRLLDESGTTIATTTTATEDGTTVKYLNNTGNEVETTINKGQYLFTKLDDGTNYITAGKNYKVEIDYDGMKYNAIKNDRSIYDKNGASKITSEDDHGLAEATKSIFGTSNEGESKTNGGYIIDYALVDNKNEIVPDQAKYEKIKDNSENQVFVTAKSESYLQKTEDWKSIWKDNNGDGEINLDSYAFDINFGLYEKFFDLNLGTDVAWATVKINGQKTTYTYDQILDGMLDGDLEREYRTSDDAEDYNLYLAYSDYNYRIEDYKVPGTAGSLGETYSYDSEDPNKFTGKNVSTELQVYVTYYLQIKNQSTHNAEVNTIKYKYDEGYEYFSSNESSVTDIGENVLQISDINVNSGETSKIELTFKVKKNSDGTFVKEPSDTSKYTNIAEIISYSTEEGRLVDADSAPGNTFLNSNTPGTICEDDTDKANGIVITFKKDAERSISGKVFDDDTDSKDGVNDVIVQLIELIEIGDNQYEYIWQETVAGSNAVKTTATSGERGATYTVTNNADGEYKFTQGIIPGNYIVRFIYGDGTTYTLTDNVKKYNGEDYKSTYVTYEYNAEWYNNCKNNKNDKFLYEEENANISKAVDNEARRLKVMSYAVDVDGTLGAKLALLDKDITGESEVDLKEVLSNTWMCAETLKIKMTVDTDDKTTTSEEASVQEGSKPKTENTQFANVNFGLMKRPQTKLVLEKHITGLTIKPVASGVNLIANATADINDILKSSDGVIDLKGQKDGLLAMKSTRSDRGYWYLQTDTTELAQGADAYITYTYVVKNEGDADYLTKDLVDAYEDNEGIIDGTAYSYIEYLQYLEGLVKGKIKAKGFTKGEYLSDFYYDGDENKDSYTFKPIQVLASVEEMQESLNPKVKFVNSTTDFVNDATTTTKPVYQESATTTSDENINETITTKTTTDPTKKLVQTGKTLEEVGATDKDDFIAKTMDTSKKLVVSVGLSASEIEDGGIFDSYIAEITHYTNAAGRRDISTPANLSYVHSYNKDITLNAEKIDGTQYNEEDEFWAERFTITKPTGEDKQTPVQIVIIAITSVAVLGIGIILIKKFVLKK